MATKADLAAIGRTHTAAFRGDPIWEWLVRRPGPWNGAIDYVFRQTAAEHLSHGSVWVTPDVTAAAVWAPPGHKPNQFRETLAAPRMAMIFGRQSLAGMRFLAATREVHPKEPHWYLYVVGTDPAHQGKGHGTAVIQPTLDRCDDEGLPAYLESSKESNVSYYRRLGFELQREFQPVPAGPPVWLMWRDPR